MTVIVIPVLFHHYLPTLLVTVSATNVTLLCGLKYWCCVFWKCKFYTIKMFYCLWDK